MSAAVNVINCRFETRLIHLRWDIRKMISHLLWKTIRWSYKLGLSCCHLILLIRPCRCSEFQKALNQNIALSETRRVLCTKHENQVQPNFLTRSKLWKQCSELLMACSHWPKSECNAISSQLLPTASEDGGRGTYQRYLPPPPRQVLTGGYPKVPNPLPAKVPTPLHPPGQVLTKGKGTSRYLPPFPPGQVTYPHPDLAGGGYPKVPTYPAPPPPGIGQHMEYLICCGRYASCVHAGLSCFLYVYRLSLRMLFWNCWNTLLATLASHWLSVNESSQTNTTVYLTDKTFCASILILPSTDTCSTW